MYTTSPDRMHKLFVLLNYITQTFSSKKYVYNVSCAIVEFLRHFLIEVQLYYYILKVLVNCRFSVSLLAY